MEAIDAFNKKLHDGGHWVDAAGIADSSRGTLIDNRNYINQVAVETSVQGSEFYNGFWIIEAADDAQATELALQGSLACNRRVEVRAFL